MIGEEWFAVFAKTQRIVGLQTDLISKTFYKQYVRSSRKLSVDKTSVFHHSCLHLIGQFWHNLVQNQMVCIDIYIHAFHAVKLLNKFGLCKSSRQHREKFNSSSMLASLAFKEVQG